MFYTVYKTTHTASGKIYIGMHQTKNPNDSYLGSGKNIHRAIKKYGRGAFTKEILFVFDSPEEMIAKEKELVDEAFVTRSDTFNLNVGGDGGWGFANRTVTPEQIAARTEKGQAALRALNKSDPEWRLRANQNMAAVWKDTHVWSDELRERWSALRKGKKLSPERCAAQSARMAGHEVSQETREKIAQSNRASMTTERRAEISARMKAIAARKREAKANP